MERAGEAIRKENSFDAGRMDTQLIDLLRTEGPRTLGQLAEMFTAVGWGPVFLAVDGLSRSGVVRLQPIRHCEYQVSLNGAVA